jgi:uncharacterized repeat protein (TIGR01451 family)
MKIKSLVLTAATAAIIPAAGIVAPVAADSPARIGNGDIYRVKNLTQNTDFADTTTAKACEELEYKVRLHNSSFTEATDIVASASLPSGASTKNVSKMTITYSGGVSSSLSDTATVNLSSAQNISYQSGSTQLLDADNNVVKSLPDGVTGGGVSVGNLKGSTTEFVQFKAKVNCPTPPKPPVTPPATPQTSATPGVAGPTTLVNTGPGSAIAAFVAATIAGAIGYRKFVSRRLSRQ